MKRVIISLMAWLLVANVAQAQFIEPSDFSTYVQEHFGTAWSETAKNLAKDLVIDKNGSLTYQEVIEFSGRSKEQLYVQLSYWLNETFQNNHGVVLNDKDAGTIVISSTLVNIAHHKGTMNNYYVSITPTIRIDIKPGKIRIIYSIKDYDILKKTGNGWMSGDGDSGRKRKKDDKKESNHKHEKWEIAQHYPFVKKDSQKRTCAKALVMTHAYSNIVMGKIKEAVTHGLVGSEDENW